MMSLKDLLKMRIKCSKCGNRDHPVVFVYNSIFSVNGKPICTKCLKEGDNK